MASPPVRAAARLNRQFAVDKYAPRRPFGPGRSSGRELRLRRRIPEEADDRHHHFHHLDHSHDRGLDPDHHEGGILPMVGVGSAVPPRALVDLVLAAVQRVQRPRYLRRLRPGGSGGGEKTLVVFIFLDVIFNFIMFLVFAFSDWPVMQAARSTARAYGGGTFGSRKTASGTPAQFAAPPPIVTEAVLPHLEGQPPGWHRSGAVGAGEQSYWDGWRGSPAGSGRTTIGWHCPLRRLLSRSGWNPNQTARAERGPARLIAPGPPHRSNFPVINGLESVDI